VRPQRSLRRFARLFDLEYRQDRALIQLDVCSIKVGINAGGGGAAGGKGDGKDKSGCC